MARRNARNRDFERGFGNRTDGLFKKAHTFHGTYGVRVAAFVIGPNGRIKAYQSDPGLLAEVASSSAQWDFSCGPESFVTLASGRSASPGLGGPQPTPSKQATPASLSSSLSSSSSSSLSSSSSSSSSLSSPPPPPRRSSIPRTPPMSAPLAWYDPATGSGSGDMMDPIAVYAPASELDLGLPSMYLSGCDVTQAGTIPSTTPTKAARQVNPDIKAPTPIPAHRRTREFLEELADQCFKDWNCEITMQ